MNSDNGDLEAFSRLLRKSPAKRAPLSNAPHVPSLVERDARPFDQIARATKHSRIVVGIAEAHCSADPAMHFITHALGSCLGIALYDRQARVGGIFHPLLPSKSVSPEKARTTPFSCVDTGFPLFFAEYIRLGGRKERLRIKVAGGNRIFAAEGEDRFQIGRRNYMALRKVLWAEGLLIHAEAVGGTQAQTMTMYLEDGRTEVASRGVVTPL